MLTADTITDGQISQLVQQLEDDMATARIATGHFWSGAPIRDVERVRRARARCAEILNARKP